MRNYKKIIALIVILVVSFSTILYLRPNHLKYRIGAIYPLTGMASSMGVEFSRGFQLAAKTAKAEGIDVEFFLEDSKTDPKAAIAAYHSLKARGVNAVLTTVTGCASAIIPMAKSDNMILFADVAKPDITKSYEGIFRHSSTAEQEADVMYAHLVENKLRNVLVFWMHDEYCLSLKNRLLSFSGSNDVTMIDVAYDKDKSVVSALNKALSNNSIEGAIVLGFGAPLGNSIKALREFGFKGDVFVNMGLTVTLDAKKAAGDALHDVLYTSMKFDKNGHDYERYRSEYQKQFGCNPQDYSLLAFNSTIVLLELAKKRVVSAVEARKVLIALKQISSIGEIMTIKDTGDILPPVVLERHE